MQLHETFVQSVCILWGLHPVVFLHKCTHLLYLFSFSVHICKLATVNSQAFQRDNLTNLASACLFLYCIFCPHASFDTPSYYNRGKEHNEEEKHHRSNIWFAQEFLFSVRCVYTCSYLSTEIPREVEQRREGGGEDEGRRRNRGKTCCSSKRQNQLLLLFSLFSEDAIGGRRGFAEWGKAGFDVIPFCNIKPVGFPEASDLDFRDLLMR